MIPAYFSIRQRTMNGIQLTKIPTSLLKKFICTQCGCYLSVGPIGVRADGQSICGRCTNWAAPQSLAVARCKLFEELASLHTFPCSYQNEGCLEYVPFNKASEHENNCPYRTYRCPVSFHSACNWNGTLTQICQHYKSQHPELYLKTPNFRIKYEGNYEIYNLLEINDVVLLLQIRCASQKKKFWFNAVCVGREGNEVSIKYTIKLSGEPNRRVMELEDKNPLPVTHMHMVPADSVEVDIDGLLAILQYPDFIWCHWNFTVADILRKQPRSDDKKVEKCPNCDVSMVPPIYRCPLGHVTCTDCRGYNEKCGVCLETNVELTRAIDLENVAYLAQFSCRWNNCYKTFDYSSIREHEQQCPKRVYTCPECGKRIGLCDRIFRHFITHHVHIPFETTKTDTLKFPVKGQFLYVLVHREIFKVSVIKEVSANWTVHITYCGPPGLNSYFKYEVRDRYNVLYYASKCRKNVYKATQSTYCTNNVRSEYYISIRFNKQTTADVWVPFDCQPKRALLCD